ncbi:hypothetical protein BLL40_11750 [Domibacillus mangrovi]|uniref:Uncharacterized protein n=1 Tax=Domibacillus mangrovi TaxID=1714354 RepID=A0A1Q5P155_9BACI|nr:hypothetical protein BLL40_11750 [Domibacillus mangrovi]
MSCCFSQEQFSLRRWVNRHFSNDRPRNEKENNSNEKQDNKIHQDGIARITNTRPEKAKNERPIILPKRKKIVPVKNAVARQKKESNMSTTVVIKREGDMGR